MLMDDDFTAKRLGGPDSACNRIDFAKDAIIEASAGTGKTYTIQNIVLKLLAEKRIAGMGNLLVVTYTDKAAGELRDRIRKVLDEAGCLPADFDEAAICTIHSFCRSLLAEYAFENRVPMQTEIAASGREAVRRAILGTLRSQRYRDEREGDFAELMAAAGFDAAKLAAEAEKRFGTYYPIETIPSLYRIDDFLVA